MYTQCPECGSAFRVTAEVLKQAAGKVRCGACGNAFNALEHLSETKPEERSSVRDPEPNLPELKPEPRESAAAPPPTAMSPEQSAALLKTLDQLAGEDVRLEDTGIEWRVLDDEDNAADAAADASAQVDEASLGEVFDADGNNGTERVDAVLSNTATPVDEVLDAGGATEIESPEVFEPSATQTVPDEELRFDDNTGLPEGFIDVDETGSKPAPVIPEPVRDAPEPMANLQVDLGFGDEWQDLLEEVGPDGEALAPGATAEAGEREPTLADELEAIQVDAADEGAEDVPDGEELASRMEALSLELSGIQEELDMLAGEPGEPSLADELEALQIPDETEGATAEDAIESEGGVKVDEDLQAAADELLAEVDEDDADELLTEDDADEELLLADEDLEKLTLDDEAPVAEDAEADEATAKALDAQPEASEAGDETELELAEDLGAVELESTGEADAIALALTDEKDKPGEPGEPGEPADEDERSIDEDLIAAAFEAERIERTIVEGEPAEQNVAPLSEEEQTINMQIDQDLMALAIEDGEGFASTIVVGDGAQAEASEKAAAEPEIPTLPPDAEVEEIVMEGAVARSGTDLEEQEAEEAALKEEAAALIAAATAAEQAEKRPVNWRLIGGVVVLVVLLALQAIHFSRDALARVPALNDIIAPIYQAVGMPLTPAWDVTGWRFEATRGSTDETGAVLSIYSRIGNKAASALPYPVISVSLTDRFEETIGSRVFEPSEYLAGDLDTRRMVEPGTTFNALMSIESPAAEATGFKLNVCYRLTDRGLRCAIEDFK